MAGPQERQRHHLELLPRARSVHGCCLVQVGRDALEGAGRDDRVERPAEPRVGGEQREVGERQRDERDRVVDLAEPVDLEGVRRDLEERPDGLRTMFTAPLSSSNMFRQTVATRSAG